MGLGVVNVDIGSVLSGIGQVAKDLREAITGKSIVDPNKAAEYQEKLVEVEKQIILAQSEINKIEASSTSVFIAGWRPFVGWICGFSLGWEFLFGPIGVWISNLIWGNPVEVPKIDSSLMIQLLIAMLGLGAFRTYEKVNNAENKR